VISGIGGRTREPVHRFCQGESIPCLLPNIDLPVVAEQDFYPVYFSRGVLLEADVIARRMQEEGANASAWTTAIEPDALSLAVGTSRPGKSEDTLPAQRRGYWTTRPGRIPQIEHGSRSRPISAHAPATRRTHPDACGCRNIFGPKGSPEPFPSPSGQLWLAVPQMSCNFPSGCPRRARIDSCFEACSTDGENVSRVAVSYWLQNPVLTVEAPGRPAINVVSQRNQGANPTPRPPGTSRRKYVQVAGDVKLAAMEKIEQLVLRKNGMHCPPNDGPRIDQPAEHAFDSLSVRPKGEGLGIAYTLPTRLTGREGGFSLQNLLPRGAASGTRGTAAPSARSD
jgi:hypothetical protein